MQQKAVYIAMISFLCLVPASLCPQDTRKIGTTASSPRLKLTLELADTLHKFARRHALSDDDAVKLFGDMVLAGPSISKGGLGLIDDTAEYVLLNEQDNSLLLHGDKWVGTDSSKTEVVITDGHHVLNSAVLADASTVKIVVFSPSRVRYIDLSKNSGGVYDRFPNR